MSSICPRNKTVGLTQTIDAVNAGLQSLCSDESLTFINNDPAFHLADGTINGGYLLQDGIHLTHKATERLAKNLNLVLERPERERCKQTKHDTNRQTSDCAAQRENDSHPRRHGCERSGSTRVKRHDNPHHGKHLHRAEKPQATNTSISVGSKVGTTTAATRTTTVTNTSSTPQMTTSIVTTNTATGHATTVAKSTTTRSSVVTATG